MERNPIENIDRELQNINQGVHLIIKKEKFENDTSQSENTDYTHCFETIDSHVKMEIDAHATEKQYSHRHTQNPVRQHQNIFSGIQNISQHDRLQVEQFENVDSTHYFGTSDSDFKDIDRFNQNTDKSLSNIKQEVKVNKVGFKSFETTDSEFQVDSNSCVDIIPLKPEKGTFWKNESDLDHANNESVIDMCDGYNIKTEEGTSSFAGNLDLKMEFIVNEYSDFADKSNVDDKCVDIMHLKEEFTDPQELPLDIEDKNNPKKDSHFKDKLAKTTQIPTDDSEAGNSYTEKNDFENSIELKPEMEAFSDEESDLRLENNAPFCNTYDDNVVKDNSCFTGKLDLKLEFIGLNIDKSDFNSEKTDFNTNECVPDIEVMDSTNDKCEKELSRHRHVREDMISQPGQSNESIKRPHKCNMCEKGLSTKHKLRDHMTSHTTWRPCKCDICEKGFKTMSGLRKHITRHNTERPHQCSNCEKGFKTICDLRKHMTHHNTERSHQCGNCEEGFKTLRHLKKHMIRHNTERPHQCCNCEKGFKTVIHLRQHMTCHITERPHQCSNCDKGFKTMSELGKHMTCHITERPHQCSNCEKGFKSVIHLNKHMIRHSTVMPHQCSNCEKGFKTMFELKRHMTIHNTESPHQCSNCEKRFKTTSKLRTHMTRHSTERPHQCSNCEKGFKTLHELRKHMTRKHN